MKKIFNVFTIVVLLFDYFVYSGWRWIIDHETCTIGGIQQICWGVSPLPTFIMTFAAIILTALMIMDWICEK